MIWVVLSTVRMNEPIEIAKLVMKTPASLAIAVNEDQEIFNHLDELWIQYPSKFLVILGEFIGQVEAVNVVYGLVRKRDPSKNHLFVPVPDDMPMLDGWYEAFQDCYKDDAQVLAGYDGYGNSGFAGLTAKYCDIYQNGWLHCPEYIHFQLDHELKATAHKHEKFYLCPKAQARHKMLDSQENMLTEAWELDLKMYKHRSRIGFSYNNIEEAPWRYWK